MSGFEQDPFLGRSSSSDLAAEIDALKDRSLFRDGSKSMTGNLSIGSNEVINVADVQLNAVVTGATPSSGITIYTKADDVLYQKTSGGVETAVGGGGGNVSGVAPSLVGNIPQFDNLLSDTISDSGVKSSEVLKNPSGVGVSGNVCEFDSTVTTIADSGIAVSDLGDVDGPGSATADNICAFDGTGGKLIKDGGIALSSVGDVFGGITSTNNAVARYDAHSGKVIQNSIVLISDTGVISSSADIELAPDTDLVKITGDAQVTGNLVVEGTTTTTESEQVHIDANYLNNNSNYSTAVAQPGGLTVRYLPTATTTTQNGAFVAGIASVSNPNVITSGSGTFAASDLIAIDTAADVDNNGIYEVLSHTGTLLVVKGIGLTGLTEPFPQNQFVADATLGARLTKVNMSIIHANTSGDWDVGKGSSTPITFSTISTIATPVIISDGGSGQTTQQNAINSLTDVSSAAVGEVLTKTGSDAVWASSGGGALSSDTSSVTVGNLTTFANTGGKLLQESQINEGPIVGALRGLTKVTTGELKVDNLNLDGNTIISLDTNGDINIEPDGLGALNVASNLFITGNISQQNINWDLQLNALGTGKIRLFDQLKVDELYQIVLSGAIEHVFVNSSGDLGSYKYGAVQLSRSTSLDTTGSYVDVIFDTTDIETNTNLLSTAGTTSIDVETTGLVEVSFQAILDPPSDDEVVFLCQIKNNGTPVSAIAQNIYQAASDKEDWSMVNRSILLECIAGDALSVEIRDQAGGAIQLKGNSIIFSAKYLG